MISILGKTNDFVVICSDEATSKFNSVNVLFAKCVGLGRNINFPQNDWNGCIVLGKIYSYIPLLLGS